MKKDDAKPGLAGTDKYSVDKTAKVNPKVSSPKDIKEEDEPGKA